MNSIYIVLARQNWASTIAHEKGHFDSFYEDYQSNKKYQDENKENLGLRHGIGDPNGTRAELEDEKYKNSKANIIATKGYFNTHNPSHRRKK